MKNILDKTINFVDDSFGKKKPHFVRTLFWIQELDPDANLALKIDAMKNNQAIYNCRQG